jgi:hypothetical protein
MPEQHFPISLLSLNKYNGLVSLRGASAKVISFKGSAIGYNALVKCFTYLGFFVLQLNAF